jgi:hypothetical protein
MTLLEKFLELVQGWNQVFAQRRTFCRAVAVGVGLLCGVGRRTLTRSICVRGRQAYDWSADYKLFSRSKWEASALFDPLFGVISRYCPQGPIGIAFDDTALRKTGKKIQTAFRQRDPISPAFYPNLIWAQRFMQASLLLPLYEPDGHSSPRGLPLRFAEAPVPKKPGRKATAEQLAQYQQLRKHQNLTSYFIASVQELRQKLDRFGLAERTLMAVGDGSFCNQRTFSATYDRTVLLTRCRKDLVLRDSPEDAESFSPLAVMKDSTVAWQSARIFYAGAWRTIEYKEKIVHWDRLGKKSASLRLLVIKPIPYQKSKNSPREFRDEAFLLCTDVEEFPAQVLLQKYFDRWEIEVNHRDEKTVLGVGHAQVWNCLSAPRVPEFMVAMYSLLLLASLECYGTKRGQPYQMLPKWRRNAKRPSCLDLVTLFRGQLDQSKRDISQLIARPSFETMTLSAAA